MEGYYLILVTKRTKCAVIGMHIIYTIKDTVVIRVNEANGKQSHPLEQRYLKMFTNIDLNSNFYFSYSYDLTRTLQHNLSAPKFIGNANIETDEPLPDWNNYVRSRITDFIYQFVFDSIFYTFSSFRNQMIQMNVSSMHFEVFHDTVSYGMHFF